MTRPVRLGLRENAAQFTLLLAINALVGAMVGTERAILPALAEDELGVAARTAILSFIVVFGLTKAGANYVAGRLADAWSRKRVLVAGWLIALPVPLLLAFAPTWAWVVAANALLGVSQGLTWSTTVFMKIDLAGPQRRGLAMGLNEFAGYLAVAGAAWATGWIAANYGLRPWPFAVAAGAAVAGAVLSAAFVRDTSEHARVEGGGARPPPAREVFATTSWRDPDLSSASQAGLVNNLNDGLAWGLLPMLYASAGLGLAQIGWLAGLYPAVWGVGQLLTGPLSDRIGRKPLIVAGMVLQAVALGVVASGDGLGAWALGAVALGAGTAMVYPTLLAAIGDASHPSWRAGAVGVYRLWRDVGYAVGAVLAGVVADALGLRAAVWVVAALTLASGADVAARMRGRRVGQVARALGLPAVPEV
jgi:MFS family permease